MIKLSMKNLQLNYNLKGETERATLKIIGECKTMSSPQKKMIVNTSHRLGKRDGLHLKNLTVLKRIIRHNLTKKRNQLDKDTCLTLLSNCFNHF